MDDQDDYECQRARIDAFQDSTFSLIMYIKSHILRKERIKAKSF